MALRRFLDDRSRAFCTYAPPLNPTRGVIAPKEYPDAQD